LLSDVATKLLMPVTPAIKSLNFLLLLQPEEDFRVQGTPSVVNMDVVYPDQEYIFGDFSERLWAYLTIQQLLENRCVLPNGVVGHLCSYPRWDLNDSSAPSSSSISPSVTLELSRRKTTRRPRPWTCPWGTTSWPLWPPWWSPSLKPRTDRSAPSSPINWPRVRESRGPCLINRCWLEKNNWGTLPFKSLGSLRNDFIFQRKALFFQ